MVRKILQLHACASHEGLQDVWEDSQIAGGSLADKRCPSRDEQRGARGCLLHLDSGEVPVEGETRGSTVDFDILQK